jgi:hypothetical protein
MTISQFKTQTKLKAYFRQLIDKIGICDSVKTKYPKECEDFEEVFKRHPQYPDKFVGYIDIKIDYNDTFANQFVVYIKKENGDVDNVSVLNACIRGKPKDFLKDALRFSIRPQIDKYRNGIRIKKCEICRESDNIEIDHHSEIAPFAKLVDDFLKINTLPIPTSFDDTIGHMKCFKESDREFEQKWIQFHNENAVLRILCKTCNGSQPKYKKK